MPESDKTVMACTLNQTSNQFRNSSDPVPDSTQNLHSKNSSPGIIYLTVSLGLVLSASVLAVFLKHWLWARARNSGTVHDPEEQARNRELYAKRPRRWSISILFELLPWLMQFSVYPFYFGAISTVAFSAPYGSTAILVVIIICSCMTGALLYVVPPPLTWKEACAWGRRIGRRVFRSSSNEAAPGPEIVYVNISNCLFTHTAMVPKNLSIFILLFSVPVEHPPLRIKSLAPWSQLSSLLPSMLMDIYSQSRFNLLPALRLSLVVFGQGQSERPRVNKEAKRVYSTIKTSNPLQNLYLHLLLSQLYATTGATDHWQDACRILKSLEYSEEHTLELVWLIDSIQLYTLEIKEDFTTRIVEFLRGVVVYLAKCPGPCDEHNGDLLRTATIMAAEWLISCQNSDNGNLPRRYILSRQDIHSGEEKRETFVLVENQRLSLSERLRRTSTLYQGSQQRDSSLDFVIRTLLIPIMAIESIATGKRISDAAPCIQRDDLRCSLEGLWDLWEGGFNQTDLLRFVLALVVPPPSTAGGTPSSMVVILLNEYLQQINRSPTLITEKALRFIGAALEYSLTTGTTQAESDPQTQAELDAQAQAESDPQTQAELDAQAQAELDPQTQAELDPQAQAELDPQLQELRSLDPWLSLHIDTILGHRFTPCVADLGVMTSDSLAVVARKRLNLYLSSNIKPELDILTLLVQSDDPEISLEAFGQGVNLLESPMTDESNGRNPGSPRPFTFALLEQNKRSQLIRRFFDPQQSTSMCQSVWIMFTEDLYPRWGLLPADWRRDIATDLVAATEWMEKSQAILAKEIKRRHASGKAKLLIGVTVLALVNYGDIGHHWMRKIPLEARDERFQERLDACAQVYLRLFATAIEEPGESAKPHTQNIVNFLVNIPDVLYNGGAIKRIQNTLGISRKM
jgi:hypothetical protein